MARKAKTLRERVSPFQAGFGVSPPVLAGRGGEQALLASCLQRLHVQGTGASVILTGPRGNGKTVLLKWLADEGEAVKVTSFWMTPDEVPTASELVRLLTPQRIRRTLSAIGVSARHASLEGSMRIEIDGQDPSGRVADALLKRAERRPLALLVDEAHTLSEEAGRALLNASQRCLTKGAPLLLVLAGTPDMATALDGMDSSFWSRSKILGIGRIDDASVIEAIEQPLSAQGISLADNAVRNGITTEAQGYPYFVQLIGDALWNAAVGKPISPEGTRSESASVREAYQLTMEDASAAFGAMREKRQIFYETRLEELYARDLMATAGALMDVFAGSRSVHREALQQALENSIGMSEHALLQLQRLGVIWSPPGSNLYYEPGIPSFFSFLKAHWRARPTQ